MWTKNIWYVFSMKPPFSNSSGVMHVWMAGFSDCPACAFENEKVNIQCCTRGSHNIDLFYYYFLYLDVDECSPVGDCMHICENAVGSYTCKCNSDFKVDDTDPKKCVRKCILTNWSFVSHCKTLSIRRSDWFFIERLPKPTLPRKNYIFVSFF